MLHSMPIRLIHIDQLETLCDFMGTNVNLGSFGVTGVKRSFALKCYNSSMLHGIHMHKVETLYLFGGQKSIWGHLGS